MTRDPDQPNSGPVWDDVVAKQAAAWASGRTISVEALLAELGRAASEDEVWELVSRETEHCRKHGRPVDVAGYQRRFPVLAGRFEEETRTRLPAASLDPSGAGTNAPTASADPGRSRRPPGDSSAPFKSDGLPKGLRPGGTLGPYELLDVLGRGGMGVVFKARTAETGRVVALKVIGGAGKNDAAVRRFHREAKAATRLEHANVVAALDFGEAAGVPYLALEYVDGPNFAHLVRQAGPLPVERAVGYLLQAARGLEYAHGRGVTHRDVKPANLLLDTATDTVKLLDLGLARLEAADDVSRASELTNTGALFGTIDYLAPEQARDAKRADARADVYSLGCTLFYFLTGRAVYPGENVLQKLRLHREGPIPRLGSHRPEVPHRLDAVFRRMVAKTPEERYATMGEAAADLERVLAVLAGREPDSAPAAAEETQSYLSAEETRAFVPKRRRRAPLVAGLIAVAAAAAAVLGFVLRPPHAAPVVGPEPPGAEPPPATPPGPAPATEAFLNQSSEAIAPWAWPAGFPAPAVAPFAADRAKEFQAAWAGKLAVPVAVANPLEMKFTLIPPGEYHRGSPGDVFGYSAPGNEAGGDSADHMRPVHRVRMTRPVYMGVHEVTRKQFRQFVGETKYRTEAELNEGRGTAAIQADGTWKENLKDSVWTTPAVKDVDDNEPVAFVSWKDAQAFCGWLSRKENASYRLPTEAEWEFACRAGSERKFGVADGAAGTEPFAHTGQILLVPEKRRLHPHPVGTKTANAFGVHDMLGNVWELCHDRADALTYTRAPLNNPAEPGFVWCTMRGGDFWNGPAVSNPAIRTGPGLKSTVGFRVVKEIPTPAELRPVDPVVVEPGAPLSPRALVQRPAKLPGLRSWSVEAAGFRTGISAIAYSPAAKLIAASSAGEPNIRIFDEQLNLKKLLVGSASNTGSIAWSPDGKYLASTDWGDYGWKKGYEGSVRIWDVQSGAMIHRFPGLGNWGGTVAWSPDGKRILAGGTGIGWIEMPSGRSSIFPWNYGTYQSWAPDSRRVAIRDNEGKITVNDADDFRVLHDLKARKPESAAPFAWSPDGKQFVTASTKGNELLVFDGTTLAFVRAVVIPFNPVDLLWAPDGKRIVFWNGQFVTWDLESNKQVSTVPIGGTANWFKPGESLVIGRNDGTVEIRSLAGLPLARGTDKGRAKLFQSALRPDGKELLTLIGTDLHFFEPETGKPVGKLTGAAPNGGQVSYAPGGDRLVVVQDKTATIIDRETGKKAVVCTGHTDSIATYDWSPDGTVLATGGSEKTVRFWNTKDGKATGQQTVEQSVGDVRWSRDGRRIAVALKNELLILSAEDKQISSRHRLPADFRVPLIGTHGLAWSTDDLFVTVTMGLNSILALDLALGKLVSVGFVVGNPNAPPNAFSPDGRTLLHHGEYAEAYLTDVASQQSQRFDYSVRPHWFPDSRRIVSEAKGSYELLARDAATGESLGTLYPSLSVGDQPLVVAADGYHRGPAGSTVFVAQTDDGRSLTLTPAEFEARFGWKNDPEKAAFARLRPDPPRPAPAPAADVFATDAKARIKTVDLPADPKAVPEGRVSTQALVTRPTALQGLKTWTVESRLHRGAIPCLAANSAGSLIATGGTDGTIRLWDDRCTLRGILAGEFDGVDRLEWTPDGRYLASLHTAAREIRLWNVPARKLLRTVKLEYPYSRMSWCPDGSRIALGREETWASLDARTGEVDEIPSTGGGVTQVAWSPDGNEIAVGNWMMIRVWNPTKRITLRELTVPAAVTGPGTLEWSPDGKRLAGSFGPNNILIGFWNAQTGKFEGDADIPTITSTRLRWSADSRYLASGRHVYDAQTRKAIGSISTDGRFDLLGNGQRFAALSGLQLFIREIFINRILAQTEPGPNLYPPTAALSADGKSFVVRNRSGLQWYDADSGKLTDEVIVPEPLSWEAVVPSPNGDRVALKVQGNTPVIAYRDGRPTKGLPTNSSQYVAKMAWSPDGKKLAIVGHGGLVRVWDPENDAPLFSPDVGAIGIAVLAWSPDGKQFAFGAGGDNQPLQIWNADTGKLDRSVGKLPIAGDAQLAWSPDGKQFVLSRPGSPLMVIDAKTGQIRETKLLGKSAQLSAQGLVATGSQYGELNVLYPLRTSGTDALGWFPDGQRLAVVGAGGVKVYSAALRRSLGGLVVNTADGTVLAVGPEGQFRVASGDPNKVMVLGIATDGTSDLYTPEEFAKKFGWKNDPEKAALGAVRGEPAADPLQPEPPAYPQDRAVTLQVFRLGGSVKIRQNGTERAVGELSQVPVEPFEVVGVYFLQKPIKNEDLAILKGLKSLRELQTWSCPTIKDGLLDVIGEHANLRRLEVHWTGITDAGLKSLTKFPRLEVLQLDGLNLTDRFAEPLAKLQRLSSIHFGGTEVTDLTVEALSKLPQLSSLTFNNLPKVTNSSAASFAKMTGLRSITLALPEGGGPLASAVLRLPNVVSVQFQAHTPKPILLDLGVVPETRLAELYIANIQLDPASSIQLGKLHRLRSLSVNAPNMTLEGAKAVGSISSLSHLEFCRATSLELLPAFKTLPSINLYDAARIPLVEYARLQNLPNLRVLHIFIADLTPAHFDHIAKMGGKRTLGLQEVKTTKAALEAFKAKVPTWDVQLQGGELK